jgi:hypothetical protein
MKRLSPAVVLTLLASAALAAPQWVKVGSAGGSDTYLDKASIARQGDDHRAWSLVSFDTIQSTPDGTRYRSVKAQHLYSCARRTTTLLAQSYHPAPMGKGPVLQGFKYEKFAPEEVADGSAAAAALALICRNGKR